MIIRQRQEDICLLYDSQLLYWASRELVFFAQEIYGLDLGCLRLGLVTANLLAILRGLLVVFGSLVDTVNA